MAKPDINDRRLRDQLAAFAAIETGPLRDGAPVRWWLTPTWRCPNMHVSMYCYRQHFNKRMCYFKFCDSRVQLSFPGDRSGPLVMPPDPLTAGTPRRRVSEPSVSGDLDLTG
jgi:hypothetical protein